MESVCRKVTLHTLAQANNSEKLGLFFSLRLLINLATASQFQRLSQTENNKNVILSRTEYGISNKVVVADLNLLSKISSGKFDVILTVHFR